MIEQLPYQGVEHRKISRRKLLAGGIGFAALALHELPKDIALNKPPLDMHVVSVGRTIDDVQLFSEKISENDEEKVITVTPEGTVLFEPSGIFFAPGREFNYVHRGGNSREAILESYSKGANLFDIDANDVGGTVRGEHGIIPQFKLRLGRRSINLYLPAVIDINEEEVRLGMSSTYEELIAYIASLNTPERPLAVSTELKRGEFDLGTLEKMFTVHRAYNVPAIMHSPDPERLVLVGNELAAAYNVFEQ